MAEIYGVDTSKKVTPIDVRDAIIRCFVQAHGEELEKIEGIGSSTDVEAMKKMDVELHIKKIFEEIGADFDNPTPQDLIKVCDKLADFSKNFRNPDTIHKHYAQIMTLVDAIDH